MIPRILAIPCFGLLASLSFAQQTPQVVGSIADGSPAPASPPAPKLNIAPADVLETKVYEQGGRKITVQKVVPIELPPIPEPVAAVELTDEQRAVLRARWQQSPRAEMLMLSVTVYQSKDFPGGVKTAIRWRPKGTEKECSVVSNINGNWLSGFSTFDSGSKRYELLFLPSTQDLDRWAERLAALGKPYTPPQLPDVPIGPPAFVVTAGDPTVEELEPITGLHNLVKAEGEKLRLAFEGRVQAQRAREAYLKANPPQPKDVVLNFWRVKKPVADAPNNGGNR